MWRALAGGCLAAAGVWALCALAGRSARQDERLKHAAREEKEREEMEQIMARLADLSDDELAVLLRSRADKQPRGAVPRAL